MAFGMILAVWTLGHVLRDSQMTRVARSTPAPFPSPTRLQIVPSLSEGLGGRTLRVVVKELGTSVIRIPNGDADFYEGWLLEAFQEISLRLNFSYTFVPLADDSWGQELSNGQWDGPIGMLTRQEADIAVALFSQTQGRTSVAEPSSPVWYDQAVLVFRRDHSVPSEDNQWLFYLKPFSLSVYLIILGSLLSVLLLLLLLDRADASIVAFRAKGMLLRDVKGDEDAAASLFVNVVMNLEILTAGLLSKPFRPNPASRTGQVLVTTWLLLGVVLTSVYSSQLTSSLTVSNEALPFTSLAQLLKQDTYTWGVARGTAQESILKNSRNKEFSQFYEKVLQFAETDPTVRSSDSETQKLKVVTGRYVFLAGSMTLVDMWAKNHCGLVTIPLMPFTKFLYLQKHSPYAAMISQQIDRMMDSGLFMHWTRKWSLQKRQCDQDDAPEQRERTLADTQSAFYMAAAGLGLGAALLGVEVLLQKCRVMYGS